ncbi:MAG: hypothetical protein AB8G96_00545 [Phycisphaerales bacterium]
MLTQSIGALCSDYYVNQKLSLKLDLPSARESVLDMFDRVRRDLPAMDRFRRYEDELALESPEQDGVYNWLALNKTAIRSGWVNPTEFPDAYRLHRLILEVAPYFLSISPLDVDTLELMYGIDLEVARNRNEIVFEALFAGSPLHDIVTAEEPVVELQPNIGFALEAGCGTQAFLEIKTRTTAAEVAAGVFNAEPISVYMTVRTHGPFRSLEDLAAGFDAVSKAGERLVENRVLPNVIQPLRAAISG